MWAQGETAQEIILRIYRRGAPLVNGNYISGNCSGMFFHLSPLHTSTSLWARFHHHFPVLSVFGHVSCQFILFIIIIIIFPNVVDQSPSTAVY